jgi:transcriptional regulator with XRE-family HTH domain
MARPIERTAFYERLERMAAEAGVSMNRLGQMIGKSGPAMQKWRTGASKPTLETRRELAKALKRPLDDLLTDEDDLDHAPEEAADPCEPRAVIYASLRGFLERATKPQGITLDERNYLASYRFPRGIDNANDGWWLNKLHLFRGLQIDSPSQASAGAEPVKPQPPRKLR